MSIRILVVEDVASAREVVVRHLKARGFDIVEAADGQSGLECASATPPDLVITDLEMPRLDGLGLLRAVQEQRPDCPAIVLSAHEDLTHILGALRQGLVYDYLIKPVDVDLLDLAVERALEVRTLRAKARELEQVTAMRQLAMTAGDQILNPLNTITLAIHLLRTKPDPDTISQVIHKLERMSDRISTAITRMAQIHRYAPERVTGNLWQINLDEATAPIPGQSVPLRAGMSALTRTRTRPAGQGGPADSGLAEAAAGSAVRTEISALLDPTLAWVAEDHEFLRDMLSLLLSETPQLITAIRAAVERGNGQVIYETAHRLKGGLVNLGASAETLKTLIRKIERAGAEQRVGDADALLRQLEPALETLLLRLRALHARITGRPER